MLITWRTWCAVELPQRLVLRVLASRLRAVDLKSSYVTIFEWFSVVARLRVHGKAFATEYRLVHPVFP